jgi:uncharacterized protein YutE (UPF0331/DUF86 family)
VAKVNRLLLQEKSETVFRCLKRVQDKTPQTLEGLLLDIDAQDIIVLNLERTIQACVDIASHMIAYTPLPAAPTMADSFLGLQKAGVLSPALAARMVKAVGLRNLLVHQYRAVDWQIVWSVLKQHLRDPVDFVAAVEKWNDEE